MDKIKFWWNIIRPKTLLASVCPVLAGVFLSFNMTELCLKHYLLALVVLLCAVSLQVLSNLINDYYDYKKGADKQGRIGFKRPLAEGLVSPVQIKKAIYVALSMSIVLGLLLIIKGGLPILLIGVSAIFFAWLYTATPYSLSYLGIADIFCLLYYGVLAVWGTNYILLNESFSHNSLLFYMDKSVICVGAICGLISMMMLMINNLRDIEDDRVVGKKTFCVRFGKRTGECMLIFYSLLMLVFSFLAFGLSFTNILFIPAYMLAQEVIAAQGKKYNKCLLKTGLLNLFFVFLLAIEIFL